MDASPILTRSKWGHSATVQMWLHINGESLPVVQAGEKAIKLRDETILPNGTASLEVVIDGQSRHSPVTILANGEQRWVQISRSA